MIRVDFFHRDISLDATLNHTNVKVISFLRVHPSPIWRVGPHSHLDFELHFIASGQGSVDIDGESFWVKGGDLFITGPGVVHSQYTDPSDPMEEYCIECIINDKGISRELAKHKRVYQSGAVLEAVQTLARECGSKAPFQDMRLHSLIFLLLAQIYSLVCDDGLQTQQRCVKNSHLERIVGFIDANYTKRLTLNDATRALYLCDRQINRIMRQELGKSFHEYLMQLRLDKARQLLEKGELTIDQVAQESGYSSKYYMYQAFSRNGLDTPASYMAQSENN
ncbi:MAG: helix-turn-helix transcriptional regulator [Clostridia bacterium]|nr:helix-turn-helix transcriptional regulator [Clostridia bacterium]